MPPLRICRSDSLPDNAEMSGGRVFSTAPGIHPRWRFSGVKDRRFAISHDDSSHAAAGASALSLALIMLLRQLLPKTPMVTRASRASTRLIDWNPKPLELRLMEYRVTRYHSSLALALTYQVSSPPPNHLVWTACSARCVRHFTCSSSGSPIGLSFSELRMVRSSYGRWFLSRRSCLQEMSGRKWLQG